MLAILEDNRLIVWNSQLLQCQNKPCSLFLTSIAAIGQIPWSFPYNQYIFFHRIASSSTWNKSAFLTMESTCLPKVSVHIITTRHRNPKDNYHLNVGYLFLHCSPLQFVTKNPNFEHQLMYKYLKNQWFALKSASNTGLSSIHELWASVTKSVAPLYPPVNMFLWKVECCLRR